MNEVKNGEATHVPSIIDSDVLYIDINICGCGQPVFGDFRKLPGFDCCWNTTICFNKSRKRSHHELALDVLYFCLCYAHRSQSDADSLLR